jgi:hypothetical protein
MCAAFNHCLQGKRIEIYTRVLELDDENVTKLRRN